MNEREPSPEERIILATIDAIEAEGISNVTTRSIAARAGANSAAINYYFRSKDNLLTRVLDFTLDNAFGDLDEFLPDGSILDTQPLKAYYRHMIWGMRTYPGICRAHFYEPLVNRSFSTAAIERLNDFLETIYAKLMPSCRDDSGETLRLALVQLQSSVLMSGLAPEAFAPFVGDQLSSQEQLDAYVDQLVDALIGPFLTAT